MIKASKDNVEGILNRVASFVFVFLNFVKEGISKKVKDGKI